MAHIGTSQSVGEAELDANSKLREMYDPIKPYQTRIMRLHSDRGAPDSPLICDLYPADILHPTFEGLGIRLPSSEEDHLIGFDAISYTWGDGNNGEIIICNGVDFPISQNLSEALRALRHSEELIQYLWVDAICIDQSDNKEKSQQVWNMLMIYQAATRVIAWLGPAQEDLNNVLVAAASTTASLSHENAFDVWSILPGISYIYTRPWFQRIWIQQEIFAARNLILRCGALSFQWSQLLSEPKSLLRLPHLQAYMKSKAYKKATKKSGARGADGILVQLDAISTLNQLHLQNLNCFERFSTNKEGVRPDIIETLLDTSILGATNPRDYIYGILGITGFPAKPMPFQEWMTARRHEIVIPIDYSTDLTSLLCAVTWAMLMKGGLTVLAKFKTFAIDDNATSEETLPSWVIDWRVAGRLFRRCVLPEAVGKLPSNTQKLEIDNAWDIHSPRGLAPWPPPVEHEQFCKDNRENTGPCTQIILRGIIDLRFFAKGRSVWEKKRLFKDKAVWHLEVDVYPTDLVVYMHNFTGVGFKWLSRDDYVNGDGAFGEYCNGGLWLLRPTEQNRFKLIACLPNFAHRWLPLYRNWEWDPGHFQRTSIEQQSTNQCRPLAVDPVHTVFYAMSPKDKESAESRDFVII